MRGALASTVLLAILFGITPAYAGSTRHQKGCHYRSQDHPRVCGEHYFSRSFLGLRMGSPPRMRGALTLRRCALAVNGITPAYAGSTSFLIQQFPRRQEHPRVCGEHNNLKKRRTLVIGSPPRMRGAPASPQKKRQPTRITPAYAGSTIMRSRLSAGVWDHPRVCGEHDLIFHYTCGSLGSPPRMRGARVSKHG